MYLMLTAVSLAYRVPSSLAGRAPGVARPLAASSRSAARARASSASATATTAADRFITGQTGNNVTPYIANLVGRDLHKTADHPTGIIKHYKCSDSRQYFLFI